MNFVLQVMLAAAIIALLIVVRVVMSRYTGWRDCGSGASGCGARCENNRSAGHAP